MQRFESNLANSATQFPNAMAITEWTGVGWHECTYSALWQKARAFSQQINQCILQSGERIILSSHNRIGLVAAFLGVWLSNNTAVFIDPDLPDSVWQEQCESADARLIVIENARLQAAKNNTRYQWIVEIHDEKYHWYEQKTILSPTVLTDCDSDIAALLFTSGTTGRYQAVMLQHDQLIYLSQFYDDLLPQQALSLTVLPLFHIAGLFCGVLQPLLRGMHIVFFRTFSQQALQHAFLQYQPEVIFVVPRFLEAIQQKIVSATFKKNIFLRSVFYFGMWISAIVDRYSHYHIGKWFFSSIHQEFGNQLEKILCGAATLSPKIRRFFLSLGLDVVCAYGLTETCGPIVIGRKKHHWKLNNVGPCIEKNALRISDFGEILYRGNALMLGYFRDEPATKQVIKNGWLHTGDVGKLDRFGNLYVMGRIKECLVFPDGKKAMPEQIEVMYRSIAGIKDFAVFGVVKGGTMMAVCAFVPQEKTNIHHTIAAILKTASRYKTPYRLSDAIAVDQIPRSNTLKIKRHALANDYLSLQKRAVNSAECVEKNETLYRLILCFQKTLPDKKNQITPDTTFAQLNIDSLQAAQLSSMISEQLKMDVNPTVFWFAHSIRDLYQYLYSEKKIMIPNHITKSQIVYEKIAVIAMDAVFPKAENTEIFWQNCLDGVDAIVEVPSSRFDIHHYYDAYPLMPGKTNSRFGGFIDLMDDFPAEKFGLKPRALEWMDPQQKMLLMQTERLLQPFLQQSFMQKNTEQKVGVYLGTGFPDYMIQAIQKRPIEKANAYSGIGMADFSTVGQVAYHFGFQGPSMIIKTACSSSLVAVHQAIRALQCGDCDVAITGGINLILLPEIHVCLTKGGFLSPDGRCKTFDAAANGYVRSEGCGLVLLKRYEDAITDHDCILATVIGSAVNQDGKSNGLTAPNGAAQMTCYQTALNYAGIKASDVHFIEAHGSGTQLGDAIEMQSIQSVYDKNRNDPLYVGALKTMIGHGESAAGIAGLIKTILVLHHQIIPPNLHYHTPNPSISFEKSQVQLPIQKTTFKTPCRYAAVSSFGVTGTNAHIIVKTNIVF